MSYYPSAYSQGAPVQVVPSVPIGMGVPMSNGVAPGVPMGYNGGYGYPAYPYNPYSIRNRLRHFFGFAPANHVRYRSDYGTWGFMGYSRRQRYVDARTGGEVDRRGNPIFRV